MSYCESLFTDSFHWTHNNEMSASHFMTTRKISRYIMTCIHEISHFITLVTDTYEMTKLIL